MRPSIYNDRMFLHDVRIVPDLEVTEEEPETSGSHLVGVLAVAASFFGSWVVVIALALGIHWLAGLF